ncbi:MAP kinase kinase (MEK) [Microbotryomycetes sp. JL201]|nr:MAP kinase kinase (MEK) [Microbotryomycetes sp. JL201]
MSAGASPTEAAPRKIRNKKGLALGASAAKPGTLSNTSAQDVLLSVAARDGAQTVGTGAVPPRRSSGPVEVAKASRTVSGMHVAPGSALDGSSLSTASPLLPLTPSLGSSSTTPSIRSAYHNKLSEQLATLELGVEFKLDLKNEDLHVLEEVGSGNGGTVSRALHVPTKAIMAKKVVHIATSDTTRKQIIRELQIMHDCSSPYIVSFYGAYLQDPHICMCMEFMDKGSLDNIYKKVGPIPEPVLGKIALAVVSGLTYLYEEHKIMHRDVKPSNILLNSAGQIKICDFGVSGELINSVADTFVGTSTYMSPERISGDPYTVKSDVWSLGITMIEVAIGKFPFSGEADDNDMDESEHLSRLRLDGEADRTAHGHEGARSMSRTYDDTFNPARPSQMGASVDAAEKKRADKGRRNIAGVSLAGSGHQMSILELLQYIVNEPAPRLPAGKFSDACNEFVNAALRKEPIGWNVRKQGQLPKELARPTPKELLEYEWIKEAAAADTDVQAFARSIP